MSDEELVRRALNGDIDAQHEIVRRFRRLFWAKVTRILRDHKAHWEDGNQDAWCRFWRKLPVWRGGKLSSFVSKVAANRLIDFRKKIPRHVSLPPGVDPPTPPPPRLEFDKEEFLEKAQESLPERERLFLKMKRKGCPNDEIQQALGLKPRAFHYLKSAVFLKLKQWHKDHFDPE